MTSATRGREYSVGLEWPRKERSWHSEGVIVSDLQYTEESAVQKPEAQHPEHGREEYEPGPGGTPHAGKS